MLQDWDEFAFKIQNYPYSLQPQPFKSATGRKVSFWSDSCSPDSRGLSQIEPFLPHCHNHLFLQHDHIKSGKFVIKFILIMLEIRKRES